MTVEIKTDLGNIIGNSREDCNEYLGIRYAKAERFKYATPIDKYATTYDATHFGDACSQYRTYYQDLSIPERRFYHREFREGLEFTYSEDCLNLNIYTPKESGKYPVLVFIHGGGFNSMANSEGYLDGAEYAKRGIILVTINYRVGIFGYLTHESIYDKFTRDGNFGLDDQLTALRWIKKHIASFGGDDKNITVMGQSAGAISLQYLCLMKQAQGLYDRAVMLSGAGAFPKFASPKHYVDTRDYWKNVIEVSSANSFEEFIKLSDKDILGAVEAVKKIRKDNTYNTMPVIDDFLLADSIDNLIRQPMKIPYMVGITNNDMYTALLARIAVKYTKANNAYMYYFDMDAPGDNNQAFHSSDLRYIFGTLSRSFRHYDDDDYEVSKQLIGYVTSFCKNGDPNGEGRAQWLPGKPALRLSKEEIKMRSLPWIKLIKNTFGGEPK